MWIPQNPKNRIPDFVSAFNSYSYKFVALWKTHAKPFSGIHPIPRPVSGNLILQILSKNEVFRVQNPVSRIQNVPILTIL